MTRVRGIVPLLALAASLGLGGCVSTFGPGSLGQGLGLGVGLGLDHVSLGLSPTSCLLTGSPFSGMSVSASAMAGARLEQVSQIQSRHSFSASSVQARMARAKRLGAGGC